MNVSCPQCSTVFRVDPAKVPERGVRARCSVCSGLIAVRRPAAAEISSAPEERVAPPVQPPVAPPIVPPPSTPIVSAPIQPPTPEIAVPTPPAPPLPSEPTREVPPPAPPAVPLSALPEPTPGPSPADEPEPAPAPTTTSAGRFTNPFLQQDPSTRARRLARALVSDLVVYHPEKRQRGLADGNLKELFGEEIRKSWEEYTDQVGEEIARTTPYFTEALNEILAEGRTLFG
ncbi:MAG TPA: zinc-ribbon domain-containing protein [Gemmatimonadales bacterium]|nr:zinc-ribbon domain-containing protein [Gemmatimonadales bacterium]